MQKINESLFKKYWVLKTEMILICFMMGFMILWTAGISPSQAWAKENKGDDVLRLFYWQAPTVFNPYLATGNKDREICRIVYEPLASPDHNGNLIPILAETIPTLQNGGLSKDGKAVIWNLKSGVKWSDGHPFTAEDLVFTWRFIKDPATGSNGRSSYNAVKSVEMLDQLRVKIIFKYSHSPWDIPFVGKQGMILPRHIFKKYLGQDSKQYMNRLAEVGTGPYRMVSTNVEETLLIGEDVVNIMKIIFKPNRFFREKGKPCFKGLELHGGGDVIMAAEAVFKEGTADYAWNLQTGLEPLATVKETGKGRIIYEESSSTERIVLNFGDPDQPNPLQRRHPFFHEKKVRQALAHAIDRNAIAALYGPHSHAVTDVVIMPKFYRSPNTPLMYPFDLKRSAALLDEAGWIDSDGDGIRDKGGGAMRIRFQTSVNRIRQKTQRIVKRALASVGVDVFLEMIDASVFFGKADNPNHFMQFQADIEAYASGNPTPDPTPFLVWYICDGNMAGTRSTLLENFTGYCNPEFDAMYRQLMMEKSPDRRRILLIQMNDLLVEDVALIPLVSRSRGHGVSLTLENVDITPWDWTTWNIGEWRRKK